jgi:DNA-binding response OmpR family regulator
MREDKMKARPTSLLTEPAVDPSLRTGCRNPTVLIAEDDFEMLRILTWSLEKAGYDVIECQDGMMLMKKLGEVESEPGHRGIDLVISDIRMPGFTGLQVLERTGNQGQAVPMILISAFADQEAQDRAESLGAAALFPKPLDLDQLVAKVQELLPPMGNRNPSGHQPQLEEEPLPFHLEVTFRHRSSSGPVRETVEQLARTLTRFGEHISHCHLVIDTKKGTGPSGDRHHLSLVISTPGRPIIVESDAGPSNEEENLYLALHSVFRTAIRKLKQKHQKSRPHKVKKTKIDSSGHEGGHTS